MQLRWQNPPSFYRCQAPLRRRSHQSALRRSFYLFRRFVSTSILYLLNSEAFSKKLRLILILSVPLFSSPELMKKLYEFCGYSVDLRCQLPNGDLETLISVKSEEDLTNIVEEYDRVSGAIKIRAVLSPPRSQKHESPSSSSGDRSPKSPFSVTPSPPNSPAPAFGRYLQSRYCLPPTDLPRRFNHRSEESHCCYACRVHKDSRLIWH